MEPRSRAGTVPASYRTPNGGRSPGSWAPVRRWGKWCSSSLGLAASHHTDDRGQGDLLAVPEPPLRFAAVAGGERQVRPTHGHRDGDDVAVPARGAAGVVSWSRGHDSEILDGRPLPPP